MSHSSWGRVRSFLEAIKFSHSIFALPFALSAAVLAAEDLPELPLVGKIVLACVCARTAAMAFNRFADADIDARNPRTADRAIPAGQLSRGFMLGATVVSAAGFVATAYWINSLAFQLSPIALVVLLGYSYTKRFTSLSHVVLGIALGFSPVGAWIAVRGEFAVVPVLLGCTVLVWTAGFDVIYACQDCDFDRDNSLHSIPSRLGVHRSLLLARALHVLTVGLLIALGTLGPYGIPYFVGVAAVTLLLGYEHYLLRGDDLSRVNLAFFTANGLVSLFFMTAVVTEIVL
ncbi:MAG: UbiA-like polyprenyltransferase [Planctomycetota bacterium]